jgi:hypothetical protein
MRLLYVKSLTILLFSIGLNFISIMLFPNAAPDDLAQLAFILFVFFPVIAFITGAASKIVLRNFWITLIILFVSFATTIIFKYNSGGLVYAPVYLIAGAAGYLVAHIVQLFIKRSNKQV